MATHIKRETHTIYELFDEYYAELSKTHYIIRVYIYIHIYVYVYDIYIYMYMYNVKTASTFERHRISLEIR